MKFIAPHVTKHASTLVSVPDPIFFTVGTLYRALISCTFLRYLLFIYYKRNIKCTV